MHLEGLWLADVAADGELAEDGVRIDFYCWDLYARVSQWYEAMRLRLRARGGEEGAEKGAARHAARD